MSGQPRFLEQAERFPRPFGKYTLLSRLATGGMAEVFVALLRADFGFEKLVVIKCLLPDLAADQRHIAMFLDEARTAAMLTHPSIVQLFDAGEVDGTYYIAMEYVEGQDLRSVLRELHRKNHPGLPLEHAAFVMTNVLSGLEYAHQKRDFHGNPLRIVHRDISPQNIMITLSGDVKIVDFGVAKSTLQLGEKTEVGQLKGKVAYMSPEQARGQPIDWRSDLFSAGVVLFEMTTGVRLFRGQTELETLRRIYNGEFPRPSQVKPGYPSDLEAIVLRALQSDRRARYQSAREMQLELLAFGRRASIVLSDAVFGEWVSGQLPSAHAQHEAMLQRVRKLSLNVAALPRIPSEWAPVSAPVPLTERRFSAVPPPPPGSERPLSSVPPPPPGSERAPVSTVPPPPPPVSVRPPPVPEESAPDSEGVRTFRGSSHSIPPPELAGLRRRAQRRTRWSAAALMLMTAALGLLATPLAANAESAWIRRVHGYLRELVVEPVSRGVSELIGREPEAPAKGEVELRPSVTFATIEVDGKAVPSRFLRDLPIGSRHHIRVSAADHEPRELDVTVRPGAQVVDVQLEPSAR